jgi:hypothetical protein
MNSRTSIALVGDLVAADRISEGPPRLPPPPPTPIKEGPVAPPQQGEDDQPQTEEAPSRALGLTQSEIEALTALSPFLGARRAVPVASSTSIASPRRV